MHLLEVCNIILSAGAVGEGECRLIDVMLEPHPVRLTLFELLTICISYYTFRHQMNFSDGIRY